MKNKIEGGFPEQEKNEKNESIKITNYLSKMLKSDRLSKAIDKTNEGVNLFGKATSEDQEMFLRILKPEERLILAASEERIPKKDKNGNWIDSTEGAKKVDFKEVTPTPDLVPNDLNSEVFVNRLKETLLDMGDEQGIQLSDEEVEQILKELITEEK